MHRFSYIAGLILLVALPAIGQQRPVILTFEDVLDRARQSSPAVVAARMRIEEARGELIGASLVLPSNPNVERETGRRQGAESTTTDYGVEIAQELQLPNRWHARIDAARAVVTGEEQRARDVERQVLRDIATLFLRALEAHERGAVAAASGSLAAETLRVAESRYAAGDVAQIDVNLARTVMARSDAETRVAAATLSGLLTHLQVLLGLTEPVMVGGSLGDESTLRLDDLVARAADRPDLRILDAEIAEAEAGQRLAQTFRWPDFGLRGAYREEEGDRIILGGVGFSLPVVDRGQAASAVASARLTRLHAERDALTRTIEASVRGAIASYEVRRAATAEYQRIVLPLADENEQLALESYQSGQTGMSDLLLVRRETLDARRALIDQLIDTRLAEVELRMLSGVWK